MPLLPWLSGEIICLGFARQWSLVNGHWVWDYEAVVGLDDVDFVNW